MTACLFVVLLSCGGPRLKKILRDWYIDDVPEGKPSPHLYLVQDGKRVVVDRQILSYETKAGCLLYETSRPNVSRALFGVLPGKTPVAAAASDSFRPWQLAFDGARRFDVPRTDENGVTTLGMDYVEGNKICSLAYQAPPLEEGWADKAPDFSRIEVAHTEFEVNGADSSGNSTLSEAVRERRVQVVDALLNAGADPNAANVAGITPLMTAVSFDPESTAILQRLLDAGAVVDAPDNRGKTALMWAAGYGRKEAVMLLLQHGANPGLRDDSGRTPAAMTGNSKEAADLSALLEKAAADYRKK
jgi:ankyrin repeat protein